MSQEETSNQAEQINVIEKKKPKEESENENKSSNTESKEKKLEKKETEDISSESNATSKVMKSLAGCLINEIQSSRIDYSLLRELNNKSATEYIEMTQRAKLLLQSMDIMNQQENQLLSELAKIDDLVEEVNKLDSVVRKLDEYTKNLHAQFHKLYSTK